MVVLPRMLPIRTVMFKYPVSRLHMLSRERNLVIGYAASDSGSKRTDAIRMERRRGVSGGGHQKNV